MASSIARVSGMSVPRQPEFYATHFLLRDLLGINMFLMDSQILTFSFYLKVSLSFFFSFLVYEGTLEF